MRRKGERKKTLGIDLLHFVDDLDEDIAILELRQGIQGIAQVQAVHL